MSSDVHAKCTNGFRDASSDPSVSLLADKILDRFDVVIGDPLDFLDPAGFLVAEVLHQAVKPVVHHGRDRRKIRDFRLLGEELQPAHFDEEPAADQSLLAEQFTAARCTSRRSARRGGKLP